MSINSYENFYVYVEHIVLHHSAVEAGGLHIVDEKGMAKGRFHSREGSGWTSDPMPPGHSGGARARESTPHLA